MKKVLMVLLLIVACAMVACNKEGDKQTFDEWKQKQIAKCDEGMSVGGRILIDFPIEDYYINTENTNRWELVQDCTGEWYFIAVDKMGNVSVSKFGR